MRCPRLDELPTPPEGKTGWPWTEQSEPLPDKMADGSEWPRISIVTPSYNQDQFIEETIRSILLQGYPDLEYIVIDGGSTDNSVEIIKKYEDWITYWVSEPDNGQSHALNKGFRMVTGSLIGWQNSDDYYHSQAFMEVAIKSTELSEISVFYGLTDQIDANSNFICVHPISEFDIHAMLPLLNMCNQSMFFRNRIFSQGEFIDESFKHAMDQEFLIRLALKGYKFRLFSEIKGYFRQHNEAKGATQTNILVEECLRIYKLIYQNNNLPLSLRKKALSSIQNSCVNNFANLRLDLFRKAINELIKVKKLDLNNIPLLLMYLVSYTGETNIIKFKAIRKKFLGIGRGQ
jgi:glycosyltransferase involved in cell wall biosynthesis